MKRIKIVGLALVAAFAFSAIAVASASAATEPFYAKTKIKFTTSSGKATFETAASKVVCETSKGSGGEITGEKTTKKLVITFETCKEEVNHVSCSNITTNKLKSELYFINDTNEELDEVGTALTPEEAGKPFATFTCFFTKIEVFGCSVAQLTPVDKLVKEFTAKFEPSVKPAGCTGLESKHEGKTEAAKEIAEGKIKLEKEDEIVG